MKKTAFITGGSTGIGNACVKKFQSEDYNVAFMDIKADIGKKAQESLENVLFIEGSIAKKEDLKRAYELVKERFGGLDVIVANAGIHRCNTLMDISDEELDLMINTNIKGTVNTIRLGVPYFKNGGAVVINASDQCFIAKPNSFGYGLTKGALGQITKSIAIELGERKIRVNAVCAATIKTPLVEDLFQKFADITHNGDTRAYYEAEAAQYILGRIGEPMEVAEPIFFLASEKASFMTGGLYLVDGGLVAK